MKCSKRPFPDKVAAVKALHLIKNKEDGKKKPVRTYQCGKCQQWHLTSKAIDEDQKPGKYQVKLDWSKIVNKS
jgi:predicted SprT family Zn-dependent metalloprotease